MSASNGISLKKGCSEDDFPNPEWPIGESLRNCAKAWRAVLPEKHKSLADFIENGFPLHFKDNKPPAPFTLPNANIPDQQKEIVNGEIEKLRKEMFIQETSAAYCVNPIMLKAKQTAGHWRVILDLSQLNTHLEPMGVSCAAIHEIMRSIRSNDCLVNWDIKSAINHLPVALPFRKYLCFRWAGRTYQFNVVPCGLNQGNRLLADLIRPILAHLTEKENIRLSSFMDDFLLAASSDDEILRQRDVCLSLFRQLGLHVNFAKSNLNASSKQLPFVGYMIDSRGSIPSYWKVKNSRSVAASGNATMENPFLKWKMMDDAREAAKTDDITSNIEAKA